MRYEIGDMNLFHPATGAMLHAGQEYELGTLREHWTDPAWLDRAGLEFAVRPVTTAVVTAEKSADPLPVDDPPASEQSGAGGDAGDVSEESAPVEVVGDDELEAMDLSGLKAAADALGIKYGGRVGAEKLRERIAAFQAGA